MKQKILLTGCAGFIGSNFVKTIATKKENSERYNFVILDALTYAGRLENIEPELKINSHLSFVQIDIRDNKKISDLFEKERFDGVLNFAAESHVDRSIESPNIFVETNVLGTLNLLNSSLKLFEKNPKFKYLQVSTDEVYGTLGEKDPAFTETTPIAPNSPYSASKAGADCLVRSFYETFKLPTIITRCSNNYGPYQFMEKFIPVVISSAFNNKKIPVYGAGLNIRDWIYVDDHNDGVWAAFERGLPGKVYNFGGNSERTNIDMAKTILKIMNKPESLISFVTDRKGHDFRYAINFSLASKELNWKPAMTLEQGLNKTVTWYLKNF